MNNPLAQEPPVESPEGVSLVISKLKYSLQYAIDIICKSEIEIWVNTLKQKTDEQYKIDIIPEESNSALGSKVGSSTTIQNEEWQRLLDEDSSSNDVTPHISYLMDTKADQDQSRIQLRKSVIDNNDSYCNDDRCKYTYNIDSKDNSVGRSQLSDFEVDLYNVKYVDLNKKSQKSYNNNKETKVDQCYKVKTTCFNNAKNFIIPAKTHTRHLSNNSKCQSNMNTGKLIAKSFIHLKPSLADTLYKGRTNNKLRSFSKDISEKIHAVKSKSLYHVYANDTNNKIIKYNKTINLKDKFSLAQSLCIGSHLDKRITLKRAISLNKTTKLSKPGFLGRDGLRMHRKHITNYYG